MFLPVARRREIAMTKVLSPLGEAATPVQKFGAPRIRRRRCGQRETLGLEEDEHIELAGIGKAIRTARGAGLCQYRSKSALFQRLSALSARRLAKESGRPRTQVVARDAPYTSVNDRYPPVPVGSAHPMNDRLRRSAAGAPGTAKRQVLCPSRHMRRRAISWPRRKGSGLAWLQVRSRERQAHEGSDEDDQSADASDFKGDRRNGNRKCEGGREWAQPNRGKH